MGNAPQISRENIFIETQPNREANQMSASRPVGGGVGSGHSN